MRLGGSRRLEVRGARDDHPVYPFCGEALLSIPSWCLGCFLLRGDHTWSIQCMWSVQEHPASHPGETLTPLTRRSCLVLGERLQALLLPGERCETGSNVLGNCFK